MRTLVLGGIRSGKSLWAEEAIAEITPDGQPVRYLATGPAPESGHDANAAWTARVAAHRDRRPSRWVTVESTDVATQLRHSPGTATLVDDVGNWLTSAMDRRGAWEGGSAADDLQKDIDQLVGAVEVFGSPLVLVSPEVGLTVVPATAAGRRFADALGSLNQRLATACDRVILVVAGQPVQIKPQRSQ